MSDTFLRAEQATLQNGERGLNALTAGFDARRNRQAGQLLSGGDAAGASNALLQGGDIEGGLAVSRYSSQQAQQAQAQQEAARERHAAVIIAGAQGLRRLPQEQRWQAYQTRVLPYLQQEGLDPTMIAQITQDVMDDASLDSVIMMSGGEMQRPQYLQGARGAVDRVDAYTGAFTPVREAQQPDAPSGFRWKADGSGAVEPIPGYVEGRSAVSTATRAPARGRSGGGSGAPRSSSPAPSGGSSLPPGFTVRR